MIIHHSNLKNNRPPYLYIGSDTRDRFPLEQYCGSSMSLSQEIKRCGVHDFSKEILWQGTQTELGQLGFEKIVELEELIHQRLCVVRDVRFYNKVKANTDFTTQGKAVYVYRDDPFRKTVILPTNHPDVVNHYVNGFQKGNRYPKTSEQIEKLRGSFSEIHKKKISNAKRGKPVPNLRKPKTEQHKINMRQPKTELHRKKLCELNQLRQNVAVEQLDKQGNILNRFASIKEAAEFIGTPKYRSVISDCCRGKQKTAVGYIWRYVSYTVS